VATVSGAAIEAQPLVNGWIGFGFRVFRGVEPRSEGTGTRLDASRGLPAARGRRDARQVVVELGEMIQCMTEPDEAGRYRAQISCFQRERFEESLGLPDCFEWRIVLDGFTCEPAADCIDRAMRDLQGRTPGLERDRPPASATVGSRPTARASRYLTRGNGCIHYTGRSMAEVRMGKSPDIHASRISPLREIELPWWSKLFCRQGMQRAGDRRAMPGGGVADRKMPVKAC
jgi:hypothetical protein